jgi:cytoskeleton protein RodZ
MEDFGGKLRQARERRGISLRQISASTKISIAALGALERNDISKLPGGVFSRAFVRSYALEVGLDPEQTVHDFVARFDQAPPPPPETPIVSMGEEDTAFEKRRLAAVRIARFVGIAAPVVCLASVFVVLHHRAPPRPAKASHAPLPGTTLPSPVDDSRRARSLAAPAPPARAAAASDVSAAQVTVDLHPRADCWVSASADGKKLFARVIKAGEHETIAFRREAAIDVGDAGSFAYSIDGREGRPLGDRGQVKTLKLTPATAARYRR